MNLNAFLEQIKAGEPVSFQDTIAVITEYYQYQPTAFSNGLDQPVVSQAGQNEGSCKIFSFAQLQQLSETETLSLFGDYYRIDVLQNPDATDHQNIRRFIQDGWAGIVFHGTALLAK